MRPSFSPAPKNPLFAQRQKRYGWWRCYNDFVGHPKWRLVAQKSGVHLAFCTVIVQALCQIASKSRSRGHVGDAEFEIIAVQTDIPPDQVALVFKTLCDIGWIEQDFIIDWIDRQPEAEDPTAAERQRQKRARDKARRTSAMGIAQEQTCEVAQDRNLEAAASSPGAVAETPAPPPIGGGPQPDSANPAGATACDRAWLLGDGGAGNSPAVDIVANRYGCRPLSAHTMIARWLREHMGGDITALAELIREANAMTPTLFKTIVESRMREFSRQRKTGPPLPLPPVAIRGRAS